MAGGITHGTSSMPRHLRWPLARDVVHEMRDDEADQRFEDDRGDGEDAGLLHHHPERLALEQEQ